MKSLEIRLVIYASKHNLYDDLSIVNDSVERSKNSKIVSSVNLKLNRLGLNAYLLSAYAYALIISNGYRRAATKTLEEFSLARIEPENRNYDVVVIYAKLRTPRLQYLDYKWNERVAVMALERRELDHAMSWLSTLGGGFSALGETFEHCAKMAGKISVSQLQLALRLGDPLLVARCKLWAALSLLQRGYLQVTKSIVKETYRLAVTEKDSRLQNMCKGVWAKLQYTHKIKRLLKIH